MKSVIPPEFFRFFVKEFEPPRRSRYFLAVHRMVQEAFNKMEKLIQFPAHDRRRFSRARQYASAWTKVNARLVPRNAMEAELLRAGRRIERRYHHVAAYVDTLKRDKSEKS